MPGSAVNREISANPVRLEPTSETDYPSQMRERRANPCDRNVGSPDYPGAETLFSNV
jgi:hypothetical protein